MKLSILIPTLPARSQFLDKIFRQLHDQLSVHPEGEFVHILLDDAPKNEYSIGIKRNKLMNEAVGEYLCFIDDDDRIADNYIELVMAGIATNPDCCSLNGIITTDGKDPKPFKHSIEYTEMFERDGVYYRPPNHLNVVRSSIAKQMVFPDWQRSEDSNYCFQLRDSGLLKVEYRIPETLYFYDFISDKRY